MRKRHRKLAAEPGAAGEMRFGTRAVADALVEAAEPEVASGHERTHPEALGEGQRVLVFRLGLAVGRIGAGGNLGEEPQGPRFVPQFLVLTRQGQRALGVDQRILGAVREEARLADEAKKREAEEAKRAEEEKRAAQAAREAEEEAEREAAKKKEAAAKEAKKPAVAAKGEERALAKGASTKPAKLEKEAAMAKSASTPPEKGGASAVTIIAVLLLLAAIAFAVYKFVLHKG